MRIRVRVGRTWLEPAPGVPLLVHFDRLGGPLTIDENTNAFLFIHTDDKNAPAYSGEPGFFTGWVPITELKRFASLVAGRYITVVYAVPTDGGTLTQLGTIKNPPIDATSFCIIQTPGSDGLPLAGSMSFLGKGLHELDNLELLKARELVNRALEARRKKDK